MKAKFYGSSDDLVEIEGIKMANGDDEGSLGTEHGCFNSKSPINATFNIGNKMRIFAIFSKGGCWTFGVGKIGRDIPLPDWPIRITQSTECLYSVQLEIDVPDGLKCEIEGLVTN